MVDAAVGFGATDDGAMVVGAVRTVVGVVAVSPHAIADAVMSNATTIRRIELFTLAVIVIG